MKKSDPPEHLSAESQALWCKVVPATGWSPGRLEYLTVALEARDRSRHASSELAKTGLLTSKEGGMDHIHPLVKVEKDAWGVFLRAWAKLGLEWTFRDANPRRRTQTDEEED